MLSEQKTGPLDSQYAKPLIIIALSLLGAGVIGLLEGAFVGVLLGYGINLVIYSIISFGVFVAFSVMWIGLDNFGRALLNVTAAAAAVSLLGFVLRLYVPLPILVRPLISIVAYSLLLAHLEDIEGKEAFLIGITTNVIIFILTITLLTTLLQ